MTDSGLHFLVVDDDGESRQMIVEYLQAMGHTRVTSAKDGAEAVRILNADLSINFIISDWDMPFVDGFSLLQRVKFDASRAHLPFLIVTSPVSMETEKVIMAAENLVDGYLIKPFRSELLKDKIEHILQFTVRGPQKQVLVVDDDADARETVIDYLKQMGFKEIIGIDDGQKALTYLAQHWTEVGLIVSDWEMPEVSGLDLLKVCKEQPDLRDIPFLMITSQSSIEQMKVMQAAAARVDQYLLKPFNHAEIKSRIELLLQRSRTHGEAQALILEGIEHLEHGRYQQAKKIFTQVLELDPVSDMALRGMGDALLKIQDAPASLPYYRKALESNPLNAKGYLKLSTIYEQLGWPEKALATLQSGILQVGFNADLHFQLGQHYSRKNLVDLACGEFEIALEIQLDHQEARLMLNLLSASRRKKEKP